MGVPSGANVGAAVGSIQINTAQAQQAVGVMSGVALGINQAMGTVNVTINQTQGKINSLASSLRGLGVAFGVREVAKFATDINQVATAFDRQSVAARTLAGTQESLNALLEAYDEATGGAIDKAQALSDVTRLISLGFADNVEEIDEFARAVRGIGVATGRPQDFIVTQLQMEMLNQTGLRLDQLGLSMEEVRQRAEQLRSANGALTQEQAYQQAVLQTANQKYGDLTKSAEAQATGIEKLAAAWKDLRLELGQIAQGPTNFVGEALAGWLEQAISDLQVFNDMLVFTGQMLGMVDRGAGRFNTGNAPPAWMTGVSPNASGPLKPADPEGADDVRNDWARGISQVNLQLNQDLMRENSSYSRQRQEAERNHLQTLEREQRSYAVNRGRAEADHASAIADIHEDAAQREQQMATDLARTIGRARSDSSERLADMQEELDRSLTQKRADSAEKVADWEEDRDEAIADRRKASADRILELETDFAREREQAQRDHELRLGEAAASLDAKAVFFEQERFKQENEERERAHKEQVSEEGASLQEAIDQLNEKHAERLRNEGEALDKAIKQANDAHERAAKAEGEALAKRISDANEAYGIQLENARIADAQRITDMEADFALRKGREDADRATRLSGLATDHNNQLTEMDRAHGERITQINKHAAAERTQLDEEAKADLLALGVRNVAWKAEKEAQEEWLRDLWDKFLGHVGETLIGPPTGPGTNPTLDPRRKQLQTTRDEKILEQRAYPPGTPEWNRLANEIIKLQEEIDALGGGTGATAGMASLGVMSGASFAFPTPVVASSATGTGGGRSLSVGEVTININGASARSGAELMDIIDSRIIHAFEVVAGSA